MVNIDDYKFDQVLNFIETGAKGELSSELIEYIQLLELIRSMYDKYENVSSIVNYLQKIHGLSEYVAKRRFNEAINLFYADNEIKKQTWRNVYASRLDRAADLALKSATCVADLEVYKKIIDSAAIMRQLDKEDDKELPKELFEKPFRIYSLQPERIGRKPANRIALAQHIDNLSITEKEKDKLKADALLTDDLEFFEDGDTQET